MSVWTETEFQRAAERTELSARTLAACSDVLVNGRSGADAAIIHNMKASQISRGLGALRDRQEELRVEAELLMGEGELLKSRNKTYVTQLAKNIAGEGLTIADADPGKVYVGRAIVDELGLVVQLVGRTGVVHDHRNLKVLPALGVLVTIAYGKDGNRASVLEGALSPESQASKSLGR